MPGLAEDLVNRSLDGAGCSDQQIGSLESGTKASQVALRHYQPCIAQLLRAAPWNFARKQVPLVLLAAQQGYASSSAQQATVGTMVIPPWTYEYAWPDDCVAARFVPWNNQNSDGATPAGNTSVPALPPTTAGVPFQSPCNLMPARMLIANDPNYPLPSGPEGPMPEWWNVAGISPNQRKVILCNVPDAELVYTQFIEYPSMWDPLFEEAFVALLSTHLALPCNPDKKEGRALRAEQIKITMAAVNEARVRDGDEGTNYVGRTAEWIAGRNLGAGYYGGAWAGGWADGPGVYGYGWSGLGFGDSGSAY